MGMRCNMALGMFPTSAFKAKTTIETQKRPSFKKVVFVFLRNGGKLTEKADCGIIKINMRNVEKEFNNS